MDRLGLTRDVYDEIAGTVGSMRAEQGGALGWLEDERVVRFFRFDETARSTGATYSPDDENLNAMFKEDWNPRGIRLAGFVHSHPPGFARPSSGDLAYSERILAAIPDLPYLVLPIVQTVPDTGTFRLIPFLVTRDGDRVKERRVDLDLIEDPAADVRVTRSRPARKGPAEAAGQRNNPTSGPCEVTDVAEGPAPDAAALRAAAFDRVGDVYDLTRMAKARIVAVGVGGAASFIEDLARAGVGEFVLIDPDVVTESNIATQQVYLSDLGRLKVSALGQRLRDINPTMRVREISASLDELDDPVMRGLCQDPIGGPAPLVTLLCGLTDNFFAQARINALALHLAVPSLCAQVWREGRGAEVTFTYPGLTPACHRCMLASRYRAYLSDGYVNNVTSRGTPIFATSRLNSIKGFLALALLHHRPDGPAERTHDRYGGLAARIGRRNMLQIRMDPDLSDALGISTFDRVFEGSDQASLLFDETVWRAQDPESGGEGKKPCPDCGGTGDLRDSAATFTDTRRIRPEER
jgi:proteasome lid subunit RPN8/RPN11